MTNAALHLRSFDVPAFLREHWQQKSLLIRSAWNEWSNPVTPDELAGLACEDHVESRIITRSGHEWELEHGPFPERRFERQSQDPWTLLVQSVDHQVACVAALLDPFRFVPNWRIDDVMVSYAVDGGGVGPHFDHYDVFLVQGLGRRRWELGELCDESTELLPHDDLRLLADFRPTEEWVLEPGDILYVPPRIAHRGIAIGDDCMTYSIGFRAPSRAELITSWAEDLVPDLSDGDRYNDAHLAQQDNPGEIGADAIARLQDMIAEKVLDRSGFVQWFGRYNTTRKNPDIDWRPENPADVDDVRKWLAAGAPLIRNPASRFSYVRETASSILLFADGRCFSCADEVAVFAQKINAESQLAVASDISPSTLDLIVALFNEGSIAFDLES
jgi:50S ribosomal protein L16 3-hydroxylase